MTLECILTLTVYVMYHGQKHRDRKQKCIDDHSSKKKKLWVLPITSDSDKSWQVLSFTHR